MKMKIALLAATIFVTPAQASTTIWTGTGATDTLSWAQLGGSNTSVASGTGVTSVGGITGNVVTSTTLPLVRVNQGTSWNGNFANGTPLLWNRGTAGDIIINFTTAVSAVGAQFQADVFGPFVARVTTSDGSFFDVSGVSNSGNNNSAVFIGAQSTTSSITSIIFHQLSGGGTNDFAISGLSLIGNVSAVPEPATWGMMIMGFGIVGGAMRRRRQKVTVTYA